MSYDVLNHGISRRGLLVGGTVMFAASWTAGANLSSSARPCIARTPDGHLEGRLSNGLRVFKGVRYATAERFRAPKPVQPWSGVRPALKLGAPCPQHAVDTPAWLDPEPSNEDCQFLNVWAPERGDRLPVMLFVHGGAFVVGSGGAPMYDGANLARRGDVVVITLNHRLNAFGFLDAAALFPGEGFATNAGLLDIVEALRWTRRNIAAFGGDASNITIFGESGGGGKISALLAMPAVSGLVDKVVIQSGSMLRVRSRDAAISEARKVRDLVGGSQVSAKGLLDAPVDRIVGATQAIIDTTALSSWDEIAFGPTLDANTLPEHPDSDASLARWRDVPLLVGSNGEEAAYLFSLSGGIPRPADRAAVLSILQKTFPHSSARDTQVRVDNYAARHDRPDWQRALVAIASDLWMGDNARRQAELKDAVHPQTAFLYRFEQKDPCFGGAWAIHAAELAYLFDHLDLAGVWDDGETAQQRAKIDPQGLRFHVRDDIIAAWTGFARSGKPTRKPGADWAPFPYMTRL